ncbi:hypothetical protein ACQ86O_19990 [Serratia sp. L9]|uniref:hypothetical protein n=1 Tax=Serratia sp. L9 TaxID=3423946 RepID=UPI003D679EE8
MKQNSWSGAEPPANGYHIHLQKCHLRNKPLPAASICATFSPFLSKAAAHIGFLFCFLRQSLYNAQRLSVEWFQPLICENAITTNSHPFFLRSIPVSGHWPIFSTSFQLWSPILNYVFHYQATLKSLTDGLAAGTFSFIIQHNLQKKSS